MSRYFTIASDHPIVNILKEKVKNDGETYFFALFYQQHHETWMVIADDAYSNVVMRNGAIEKTKHQYDKFYQAMKGYTVIGNEKLADHSIPDISS